MPRLNKLNEGFDQATSNNLPEVYFAMVIDFIQKSVEDCVEIKGWKILQSCRENYGDNAIGYVQVKRVKKMVEIIAKITPEHKINEAAYSVSAKVDEGKKIFQYAQCHDCVASQGICKHAIAFVMWLHRRSESPSTTSTECYWKKSVLSTVKDHGKYLKISDIAVKKKPLKLPENIGDDVLHLFLQNKPDECQLLLHFSDIDAKKGSIHSIAFEHRFSRVRTPESFLIYAEKFLSNDLCQHIEKNSRDQSNSPYWFEMRYGRISASKIFEVSRCATPDGSLVNQILGTYKFKGNSATLRGNLLEHKVLEQLEVEKNQKFSKSGFLINKKYPFFGASPDGVSETHVAEIKCAVTEDRMSNYINMDGTINTRYYAQVHTQMFLAKKRKGFFCVADPNFETNSKVNVIEIELNKKYCVEMLKKARSFWKDNIYPKIKLM